MRLFTFVLASAVLCACVCTAADDPTVSLPGVHDLTAENFDKIVNGGKHVLVEFYAPWCGHCKRMTEDYKKLGAAVEADPKLKSRVVIAKVNADTHKSLGERFGVRGFPTIKWFGRGKAPSKDSAESYDGGRTSDKFLEFILQKLAADKGFARVEELDTLAVEYAAAPDKDGRSGILEKAKAAGEKLGSEAKLNAELYIKFMSKALEGGKEVLAKEAARLERMIGSGSVAAAKLEEMTRKSSVLGAFLPEEVEVEEK